jgi:hypothetical protein
VTNKPLLSKKQKAARVDFARKYIGTNWQRVVFTDSKYWVYQYSDSASIKRKWVSKGEVPIIHKSKKKLQLHAYAGISYEGVTPLFAVSGTTGHKQSYVNSRKIKLRGVGAQEYSKLV